ncbi:TPA: hypothetical protein ACGGS8_003780, partial [Vibrio cholerae]
TMHFSFNGGADSLDTASSEYVTWSVTQSKGVSISSEGVIYTGSVEVGDTTVTVTGQGKEGTAFEGENNTAELTIHKGFESAELCMGKIGDYSISTTAYGGSDGANSSASISFTCHSNGVLTIKSASVSKHISGSPAIVLRNNGETLVTYSLSSKPGSIDGESYTADKIYLQGGHYNVSGSAESIEGKVKCSSYVYPGKGSFSFSSGLCDIKN